MKLDSILLFALLIPFIMTFRIGPDETPYALFGLIFLGLFLYIALDFLHTKYTFLKDILLWILIAASIGSGFVAAMIVRHQTAPIYMIHDIVLQQEAAIRFLLDGKNPYATTYFDTPLEQWHYSPTEINPALYHFVMEPFYLFFALPFYAFGNIVFGFFDGRMPLVFLFFWLLLLAAILVKDPDKRRLFLILLAFNPAMLPYTLEGRSDIFMFSFMATSLFLLHYKRYTLAGFPMGLAFAVKQSVWPIIPFYIVFLYFTTKSINKTIKNLLPLIITFAGILLPFFLWDPNAFLDSTVGYLSGTTEHSYPISGYGIGKLLVQIGFIKDIHDYYPFHVWQLIIGLPLLAALIKFLKGKVQVKRLLIVYGLSLFVFWYLSRYFNNSHLGYLSLVFITAYFWPHEKVEDET